MLTGLSIYKEVENKELLNYSIVFVLYFSNGKKENIDLVCLFIIFDIDFKDLKASSINIP